MKRRIQSLLIAATLGLTCHAAFALDFQIDISTLTEAGGTSYVAAVYLNASFDDFDELIDGFAITSPGGDLMVTASTEFLGNSDGKIFAAFTAMTSVIYGDWTLEQTVFDFPIESGTFRVQSAGLAATDLPVARILSPVFDSLGVSTTPAIIFSGPANAARIGLKLLPESGSYPNNGYVNLPANSTQFTAPYPLNPGLNEVFLFYELPRTLPEKVTVTAPTGVRWSSLVTLSAETSTRFTVGGSVLRLLGPERIGAQFRWSFASEVGRIYDVLYKDDLSSATWLTLQTINGDGGTKFFTATPGQPARFFQVARR